MIDKVLDGTMSANLSCLIKNRIEHGLPLLDVFQVLLCTEDIIVGVTRFVCNW